MTDTNRSEALDLIEELTELALPDQPCHAGVEIQDTRARLRELWIERDDNSLRDLCKRAGDVLRYPSKYRHEQITALMEELEAAGRSESWISVDERLPEPHAEVLLAGCNELTGEAAMMLDCMADAPAATTHWQPLPPPPKEPAND